MILKNEEMGLFTHLYLHKKMYRLLSRKQITRDLNRYKLSQNQPLLDNMVYESKEFWKRKEKQNKCTRDQTRLYRDECGC
jgi:hypothetical protein